jgi:hypothetical protein
MSASRQSSENRTKTNKRECATCRREHSDPRTPGPGVGAGRQGSRMQGWLERRAAEKWAAILGSLIRRDGAGVRLFTRRVTIGANRGPRCCPVVG